MHDNQEGNSTESLFCILCFLTIAYSCLTLNSDSHITSLSHFSILDLLALEITCLSSVTKERKVGGGERSITKQDHCNDIYHEVTVGHHKDKCAIFSAILDECGLQTRMELHG